MTIIKALTISQPYASLIARGEKWIENRRWPTDHRGLLAIHAGKGTQYLDRQQLRDYPTGCVIAIAELVACVALGQLRIHRGSRSLDRAGIDVDVVLENAHAEGPWCWILRNVRPLRVQRPARGAQGLWDWDDVDQAESLG